MAKDAPSGLLGRADKGGESPRVNGLHFLRTVLDILSWRFVALVLLTLLIGLISGVSLVLLMPMLQVVGLDVSGGAGGKLVDIVFSTLGAVGLQPNLPTVLLLNALAVVFTALLMRFQAVATVRAIQAVVKELRQRLYDNICHSDWLYIAGERTSDLNHVLLGEINRVAGAVSSLISLLVTGGRAVVYIFVAVVLSPFMTALTLGCGLVLSLLLLKQTQLGRVNGEALSEAYRGLYSATGEHLAGIKYTKSHSMEDRQTEEFRQINQDVSRMHQEVVRNQADVSFWLQVGTVAALSVIVYNAFAVLALPVATVLVLIYLFSRLLPLLATVQRNYQSLLTVLPAFANVEKALRKSRSAREAATDESRGFGLRSGIELRGIRFRYRDDDGATLDGLDLHLDVGKTTALVGPSGVGKSTVADIVIGLLTPDSGEVLIDGELLTAERRRAWRSQIAYVSQDVFLFHDTIRQNLLMARPDASERELRSALESAAAGFVDELPDGLETVVGDRGVRLSGGERQRLALARALLRRPALLVLDEATSALDGGNEEKIVEAIEAVRGEVTILLIAHRLTTVRSADSINYVEAGRIVESGEWDELLLRDAGRFRALAASQGFMVEAGQRLAGGVVQQ